MPSGDPSKSNMQFDWKAFREELKPLWAERDRRWRESVERAKQAVENARKKPAAGDHSAESPGA